MFFRIIAFLCSVSVSAALLLSCKSTPQDITVITDAELSEASVIHLDFDVDDYYRPYPDAVTVDLSLGEPETVTSSGAYRYSGVLENGSITVNTDKTADEGPVYIILDNAHITSPSPVNITEAKKVVIILEDSSVNTLTQTFTDTAQDIPDAALYSKADLTITGKGSLNVISEHNDGINSRDDLKITGGNITVTSVGDGIVGKDAVYIENGVFTVNAGKDGIRSTNTESEKGFTAIYGGTFNVTSVDDGIQSAQDIYIENGIFTLTSGGGYNGITATPNDNMGIFGEKPQGGFQRGERPQSMPEGQIPPDFENGGFKRGERPQNMPEGELPPDFENREFPKNKIPQSIPRENATVTDTTEQDSNTPKAINCEGKLNITGGSFEISSSHDAVSAKGDIALGGGNFDITAGDDAIHSDACITADGGEIIINNCYEGLEAQNITVNSVKADIISADDGININVSGGVFTMNGGEVSISAGGDGIDSNGRIILNGGSIIIDVSKTGRADTPIDCQTGYENNGCTVTDTSGNAVTVSNMPGHGGFGTRYKGNMPDRKQNTDTPVAVVGNNKT